MNDSVYLYKLQERFVTNAIAFDVVPDSNTHFQPRKSSESNLNGNTMNSQLELADLEYCPCM